MPCAAITQAMKAEGPEASRSETGEPSSGTPDLRLDLHNHTDRSFDASNTLRDYERAHAAGRFDILGVTDHNRIDGAIEFAERASFPVVIGVEIDSGEGELDRPLSDRARPSRAGRGRDRARDSRPGRHRLRAASRSSHSSASHSAPRSENVSPMRA